ncbi:hypothetical protein [Allocoleopsis sp.]|uniref:hypothetical protein n=1 Tax=Allocoleopsis sp. TaxID=3088169 RepID=UPI002FD4D109
MSEIDNIAQKLSEISGVPSRDIQQTWARVKQNGAILDGCGRHDFSIDLRPEKVAGKRWKCANCGGEVNSENKYWYELGLEHND